MVDGRSRSTLRLTPSDAAGPAPLDRGSAPAVDLPPASTPFQLPRLSPRPRAWASSPRPAVGRAFNEARATRIESHTSASDLPPPPGAHLCPFASLTPAASSNWRSPPSLLRPPSTSRSPPISSRSPATPSAQILGPSPLRPPAALRTPLLPQAAPPHPRLTAVYIPSSPLVAGNARLLRRRPTRSRSAASTRRLLLARFLAPRARLSPLQLAARTETRCRGTRVDRVLVATPRPGPQAGGALRRRPTEALRRDIGW
ncbi:uncharacterized protein A4U43_UnF5110 [Asparagus officinalis]|uniref:Uncharacterized protein n=1 Tax=Asparagus officinalis TaxID=4686 RepID=A0A1R3L6S8_ASPOF|nr:uncharacterized protein A4U43_UnF5110 [Asparagus officinalis]